LFKWSIQSNSKSLSLANNSLGYLSDTEFYLMRKMENLDLSSNHIQNIRPKLFSNMLDLKQLYLHNNPWIPKFYNGNKEFQTNTRLILLTYANGSTCNRSITTVHEMPLTAKDCCKYSNTESCQQTTNLEHNPPNSLLSLKLLFHQKNRLYIVISISILIIICALILFLYRKKCSLLCKQKCSLDNNIKNPINHYHKPFISTRQKGKIIISFFLLFIFNSYDLKV
jgi:hypothetical protein